MKLNVPFFQQTTKMNCGPAALKMVLAYFGKDECLETLEFRTKIREGKGVSTAQIAMASALSGFRTELYSKDLEMNEYNSKLDFYKKYSGTFESSNSRVREAIQAGASVQEKTFNLDELLGFATEGSVPIVLLDFNVVKGEEEKGYQGHFVPVVGYDENNVYVHNHGLNSPKEFMKISKETFDKARKAQGTDEDVLVVYKD